MKLPVLQSLACELQPGTVETRLFKRPTVGEVSAIFLALAVLIFISLISPYEPDPTDGAGLGFDWRVFKRRQLVKPPITISIIFCPIGYSH